MIITFVVDDMRRQYLIAVIILLNLAAVAQVIVSPEFQYSDIIAQEKFPLELNNINDSVNDAKQGTASPIVVDYVSESVLSTGSWVKMGILNTGVHKLTFDDIENMGFNPLQLDVNKIGVFGNYSGLLPEANNISRPDDLQENSIFISGADDGSFDVDDYILFYGQAATKWSYYPFVGRFTHETNIFSDTTYYFLPLIKELLNLLMSWMELVLNLRKQLQVLLIIQFMSVILKICSLQVKSGMVNDLPEILLSENLLFIS